MATFAFTTTDTTFTLTVNSAEVGTWDKTEKPDHAYKVDITGPSVILSLNNPYYSATIGSSDTLTIDGEAEAGTIAAKGEAIKDAVYTAGGATEVTYYSRKTVLTDAQIKALPSTPVELVPAPGAGKVVMVSDYVWQVKTPGADYTNIEFGETSSITLIYGADYQDDASEGFENIGFCFENNRINRFCGVGFLQVKTWEEAAIINKAVYLYAENGSSGNFTGGHASNTLEITVFYSIVDL
jgi:hypothetical protein